MNHIQPQSDFVLANGIRLHYLDWGGSGPTLIFLTGMGSTAYIFGKIAPRFTDRFRLLALTRRGKAALQIASALFDFARAKPRNETESTTFRGGVIEPFKLNGYESLSIRHRYT